MQGDTIAEDTPVLYTAYTKNDPVYVYEYPSVDSFAVEKRGASAPLEVIGERADWLEVKMRTTRRYRVVNELYEERKQLERLYVHRSDVWSCKEVLLSEKDMQAPLLASYIDGERYDEPKRVPAERFVRMELVSPEEFAEARKRMVVGGDWEWHPGALRAEEEVLVPVDTGAYLRVQSHRGNAGAVETARTWAIIDSLLKVPHASERVLTWEMYTWDDQQERAKSQGDENGYGGDCSCEDEEDECYYLGDIAPAGLMVFERPSGELSELLYLKRSTASLAHCLVGLGKALPAISPDSTHMVGISARWLRTNRAIVTVIDLREDGGKRSLELGFPLMEFCPMEGEEYGVFVADGSLYAAVFPQKVAVPCSSDYVQYVRISPTQRWGFSE